MNNTGILNSQSTYNRQSTGRRAGLDIHLEYRGPITRAEVDKLATLAQARLDIARFHGLPPVRVQELQKQVLLLKNFGVTL